MNGKEFLFALALFGCASPPPELKLPALPDLPRAIAEDVRFPSAGRQTMAVAPAPLLGLPYLASGNLAGYGTYKLLLIHCRTAQQAGGYIFDIKNQMKDPKFVASYGGYFSETAAGPLLVFAKGNYVAGIVGLGEESAVQTGKDFAARIPY